VLPANIKDKELFSHQGLTYGGFVFQNDVKLLTVIKVVEAALAYLNNNGISSLFLKNFPSFFNISSTDELEYVWFLLDAKLYRRDVALVVDLENRISYSGNIRREGNKAQAQGAVIKEDDALTDFWNDVLVPELYSKHGVKPVHTLEEIQLLKNRFPESIKQYNVYLDNSIVAGTTIFLNSKVAHCQYISSNEIGRKSGALNFLFKHLVDQVFQSYKYFDFGIVNENSGRTINGGMLFWKESFGGRSLKQDFYEVNTSSYTILHKYLK
jgi:hypothetical protein